MVTINVITLASVASVRLCYIVIETIFSDIYIPGKHILYF